MSGSEEVEGMMGVERVGQGRMREVRGSFVPQLGHAHTQPWRGIAAACVAGVQNVRLVLGVGRGRDQPN